MSSMSISSPAFENNAVIPKVYTCDGDDTNPPLAFSQVPPAAKSLALIVDDPDAPMGIWVHWVMWNLKPETVAIGANSVPPGAMQGRNDWHKNSYGGPCPPSGSHRYFFKLYALDALLDLGPSATKKDLERAMDGHIIATAEIVGLYARR